MADIHIDPIVVRETRERLSTVLLDIKVGQDAADALLWVAKMSKAGAKPRDMFSIGVTANDSTGTAKPAEELLRTAAQQFHGAILEKAVEIAQAQLKAAEKARKEALHQ